MQTRHFPFLCFEQIKTAKTSDGKYSLLSALLTDYWQNLYLSCTSDADCYALIVLANRWRHEFIDLHTML